MEEPKGYTHTQFISLRKSLTTSQELTTQMGALSLFSFDNSQNSSQTCPLTKPRNDTCIYRFEPKWQICK